MVALLGPSMAIYAADILPRRNLYDGRDLSDQTRTGPFWYTAGVNWAAATALIADTAVASQALAAPLYTGPIARAAGDIDLSLPAGLLVSAAIYLLMMRSRCTRPRRRRTLPSVDSVHLHAAGPDGDSHVGRTFSAFLKAASAAGLSSSRQS